jgi:predicted nucleic acid-binding protein
MIVVLDVSATMEIILHKDKKEKFEKAYQSSQWVIAPDIYISEITNVLWKYNQANVLGHEDCIQFVEDGIDLIDDFISVKQLWKEALGESIKNNHSVYDMFYAILTRRNDAILITNDKLLSKICKKMDIRYLI